MAGPLIGLAARALAGVAGKAIKQYAKGSGTRKPSRLSEAGKDLKEVNKGLKNLEKDIKKDAKKLAKDRETALDTAQKKVLTKTPIGKSTLQ
jgi:flagellar motility protein MotE (MotC chaperone)